MPDQQISLEDKQRLLEAMLAIRSLRDTSIRNHYVAELESRLGRLLEVPRYAEARHDLWSVLGGALSRSGGLRTLVRVVYDLGGDDPAVRDVERLVEQVERHVLVVADRAELLRLLSAVDPADLATATGARAGEKGQDPAELLRRLEATPMGRDGVPALLAFVDRLAHVVDGERALSLHRWVDLVSGGLGLSQAAVRNLCITSRRVLSGAEEEPVEKAPATGAREAAEPLVAGPILPPRAESGDETERAERRPIWGGVPIRNPDFTGRETMLVDLNGALIGKSQVSVLPQTLHGLGGVGKTQLAVEYVYRFVDQYDLVWWIPAEQPPAVLSSLARLGARLDVPESDDLQQTVASVLDALAATPLRWLLVYDNADQPDELVRFVPTAGGHVIITSRNQEWGRIGDALEVDVFDRPESIELIRKRGTGISEEDADRLAEKLGDLPLALEQAATWQSATGMPVAEYLLLFDEHVRELLSEGKPPSYPMTVAAFLALAVERLWRDAPAAAQLFEMFAYLGAEPVSAAMLRAGRGAQLSEPLRATLREPIRMNRAIRELRRVGLARVAEPAAVNAGGEPDRREPSGQLIQVHRLMQLVLRDGLEEENRTRSLANVQRMLAFANPGDPDEQQAWAMHAEIGPHIVTADLINAEFAESRQVVIDQMRYLYLVGDYENSRRLAESALSVWRTAEGEGVGPDGLFTLLATRHLAGAVRSLGESARARELTRSAYEGLRRNEQFGEEHEYTLITANSLGLDLRIQGDYRAALEVDLENLRRHERVFGEEDLYTLRVRRNVAVNLRMLGEVERAHEIDADLVRQWSRTLSPNSYQAMQCEANVARDLLAMGQHGAALDLLARVVPGLRREFGPGHAEVLLASRTQAIALLRLGEFERAVASARETYNSTRNRFGPNHEQTLAAAMTLANALRTVGEAAEARELAEDAIARYHRDFGPGHPFTLAAEVNLGLILRLLGESDKARALDERAVEGFSTAFSPDHTYTLRTQSNLANDLAMAGAARAAHEISERTYAVMVEQRGEEHPHTLAIAGNVAFDRMAVGEVDSGRQLLERTLASMTAILGPDHPDTVDRARGRRAECDLEPSPT
ncbi:FxSxx-COOH system tetratricopeptide repeat protein [Actinoplanes sp. NPDC049596]|uniref:FxSxx-COOH system tetratricopeptide repeat protein n=1 Tax=unclassified Actinoplanes TaxID=2626549 RepID=UPI00341BF48A